MTRRDLQRVQDILAAVEAIRDHQRRGDLGDDLVFDAIRVRLIEIGEAVKGLSADLVDAEPDIPWAEVAGMSDRLAHRYFDVSHSVVRATVEHDLTELEAAVRRMEARAQAE